MNIDSMHKMRTTESDDEVISVNKIMQIPLTYREVQIIGRHVCLTSQNKKWLGFISMVTPHSVVLINVICTSITNFQLRTAPTTSNSEIGLDNEGQMQEVVDVCGIFNAANLVESRPFSCFTDSSDESLLVYPMVTFARHKLSDVHFVVNHAPKHSHFQTNELKGQDERSLTTLRTHVRRYIAHTAQGNNKKNLSVQEYLKYRYPEHTPTETILSQIVKEETDELLEVEQQVKNKEQDRTARMQSYRNRVQHTVENYSSHINRVFQISALHLTLACIATCAFFVFIAVVNPVIRSTQSSLYVFIAVGIVWSFVVGIVTAIHGKHMVNSQHTFTASFARFCCVCLFLALTGGIMLSLVSAISTRRNVFSRLRLQDYFYNTVITNPSDVCDVFRLNRCTGWFDTCADDPSSPFCPSSCGFPYSVYTKPCGPILETEQIALYVTFTVFFVLQLVAALVDIILLIRLPSNQIS